MQGSSRNSAHDDGFPSLLVNVFTAEPLSAHFPNLILPLLIRCLKPVDKLQEIVFGAGNCDGRIRVDMHMNAGKDYNATQACLSTTFGQRRVMTLTKYDVRQVFKKKRALCYTEPVDDMTDLTHHQTCQRDFESETHHLLRATVGLRVLIAHYID